MTALNFSIVIPAKNEAQNLELLLPKIRNIYPDIDIIVVNDGSSDNTVEVCESNGVKIGRAHV